MRWWLSFSSADEALGGAVVEAPNPREACDAIPEEERPEGTERTIATRCELDVGEGGRLLTVEEALELGATEGLAAGLYPCLLPPPPLG